MTPDTTEETSNECSTTQVMEKQLRKRKHEVDGLKQLESKKAKISSLKIRSPQKVQTMFKKDPVIILKRIDHNSSSTKEIHKLVWSKWGKTSYYPAITIQNTDAKEQPPKPDHIWLMWLEGSNKNHQISQQRVSQIMPFFSNFADMHKKSNKGVKQGIMEALRIAAEMSNINDRDEDSLKKWAMNGFDGFIKQEKFLKEYVISKLKAKQQPRKDHPKKPQMNHKENYVNGRESEDYYIDDEDTPDLNITDIDDIEKVCLVCKNRSKKIIPHPFFEGGLCQSRCSKKYKDALFLCGSDGKNICCKICGMAGNLYICTNENCPNCYCKKCLRSFLTEESLMKIEQSEEWDCFLCSNETMDDCALKIRNDWNECYEQFLDMNEDGIKFSDFCTKRPINVLSLYDGIATGLFVLKALGIKVGNYFASEIDVNAINVAKMNHRHSIKCLGDVEKVYVDALPRIDLVIGGSPCNDFSLANPMRKNFDEGSQSRHFFVRYIEILNEVRKKNKNMFFLFENVCPMENPTSEHIKEYFQMIGLNPNPSRIDAIHYSAMKRNRYFWGNIPGLHSIPKFWTGDESKKPLQDYLEPYLDREAAMEVIRTVTSQSNSLVQNKGLTLPVFMNSRTEGLYIIELERLFGFSKHYTDAGMRLKERLGLLGKSWSVPVIKMILKPLRNFFSCD